MLESMQKTLGATVTSITPSGDGANWIDKDNVLVDDDNYAWIAYATGSDFGATIIASDFGFNLPQSAKIRGISVDIRGQQFGMYGDVSIGLTGSVNKDIGTLNQSYGGSDDLWGLTEVTVADLADIEVSVFTGDISGAIGSGQIEYLDVTVHWELDQTVPPTYITPRVEYKVYSRDGNYLGNLPNVTSNFAFSQDINSAGSVIDITCAQQVDNITKVEPLETEAGDPIQTEQGEVLFAASTDILVAQGVSQEDAIFKNSNRVKAYLYNRWNPNGKLMFSGQVNKIAFQYGDAASAVVTVFSDGLDMDNYIARAYPFAYTDEVSQTESPNSNRIRTEADGTWVYFGQTWTTNTDDENIGAIELMLKGNAQVTLSVYDAPNGNLLGSVTRSVSSSSKTAELFEFSQLIPVQGDTTYFYAVTVPQGQEIRMYRSASGVYSGGERYWSVFSGGSGGSWTTLDFEADYYFVIKSGEPTTTINYANSDPVTETMNNILLDYNGRGGVVKQRDFQATGLSLSYLFNMATVYDALTKVIELSPTGYYFTVDLGTAELDILNTSETADFTVVRGRDVHSLDITLSIENVKNSILFTGGEVSEGVNLFKQYNHFNSAARYGLRTSTKSDNRVTDTTTADAIGIKELREFADERQQTSVVVLDERIDITKLVPGKTVGFRNFGNFIDSLVLQIVRREYSIGSVKLTLGHLPIRLSDELERINRELLNEQTLNNPDQPS